MKNNKKIVSIYIDQDLWKNFKIIAIEKNLNISEYLESLIKKELKEK